MILDGYTILFTKHQKDMFQKHQEQNPERFTKGVVLIQDGEFWCADISKMRYCLIIVELREKGELYLSQRMKELGKLQDVNFLQNLEMAKKDLDYCTSRTN